MDTQVFSGEKKVHLLWPDAARQRRLSWGSNGFLVKKKAKMKKKCVPYILVRTPCSCSAKQRQDSRQPNALF